MWLADDAAMSLLPSCWVKAALCSVRYCLLTDEASVYASCLV